MPTTIKAGIIGTGFIGPAHVEAGRRLGNVEFIAVEEANEDLAKAEGGCPVATIVVADIESGLVVQPV